jgi:hypothetical protein
MPEFACFAAQNTKMRGFEKMRGKILPDPFAPLFQHHVRFCGAVVMMLSTCGN